MQKTCCSLDRPSRSELLPVGPGRGFNLQPQAANPLLGEGERTRQKAANLLRSRPLRAPLLT
ncbi:hypothetical protein PoB_001656500 [Plakobranchus ocellatus]|uniref:Uncharacterized protein n=1 Tax=Plakobranchus ocellatus TaxID=259542 RepID=A0AAV3Z4K1_9GAST|nr:hypothetical protein PoB_001656500 [Plakobranchus ocellatus]